MLPKNIIKYILPLICALSVFAQHNQLSPEEEMAGYDLLFNGEDLDNWHAYRENFVTDAWFVETNEPLGVRIENGPGQKRPILTNQTYMNFDFKVNIQTPVDGNSGVFFRYEEEATSPGNTRSGPEMQVCGPADGDCINPIHKFGAAYDMFPVVEDNEDWMNDPGQWNELRVIAYDSNYVHYGNGLKLLEYKIGTPEFIAAYNQSKYVSDGNDGNYYDIHPGGILLQHHGEEGITFRNIMAKELSIHPFLQEFVDGMWPDELPQDFVFGERGCTDSEALNYSATAEVDDESCEYEVSIHSQNSPHPVNITLKTGTSGYQIHVPFAHSEFSLRQMNGRELQYQIQSKGVYSVDLKNLSSVVIATVQAGEHTLSKPLFLH